MDSQAASSVFLNVPYDEQFEELFLAYIAALSTLGLTPHAAIEVPAGGSRLEKIYTLVSDCRYSVHDLSRAEAKGFAPRFNMPFELGLAVATSLLLPNGAHQWFVFESEHRRVERTLSDLRGTDAYIHEGRPARVFGELCNAFVRADRKPVLSHFNQVYDGLKALVPDFVAQVEARSLFEARVFQDLVIAGRALSAALSD